MQLFLRHVLRTWKEKRRAIYSPCRCAERFRDCPLDQHALAVAAIGEAYLSVKKNHGPTSSGVRVTGHSAQTFNRVGLPTAKANLGWTKKGTRYARFVGLAGEPSVQLQVQKYQAASEAEEESCSPAPLALLMPHRVSFERARSQPILSRRMSDSRLINAAETVCCTEGALLSLARAPPSVGDVMVLSSSRC